MCDCKACAASKLNPEPSDTALYTLQRHKAAGTSPGNPKWYRAPTMPKLAPIKRYTFLTGIPRSDPRRGYHFPGGQVGQAHDNNGGDGHWYAGNPPNRALMAPTESTAEYVARFCKLNSLKP